MFSMMTSHLLLPSFPLDYRAWDGKHLSNTYSLLVEDEHNCKSKIPETSTTKWNGVLIEADPSRYLELKTLHDPLGNMCINTEVSCQPTSPQSLLSILKRDAQELSYDFDFLSIDVDGIDYWLLVNILEGGYRPKCICIEFNPTMPTDLIYIQPRDDNIRHGSSLSAMVELLIVLDIH